MSEDNLMRLVWIVVIVGAILIATGVLPPIGGEAPCSHC